MGVGPGASTDGRLVGAGAEWEEKDDDRECTEEFEDEEDMVLGRAGLGLGGGTAVVDGSGQVPKRLGMRDCGTGDGWVVLKRRRRDERMIDAIYPYSSCISVVSHYPSTGDSGSGLGLVSQRNKARHNFEVMR